MKILFTSIGLILMIVFSTGLSAQTLPKEIRADQYMIAVKKHLEGGDNIKALRYMEKIITLGIKGTHDLIYHDKLSHVSPYLIFPGGSNQVAVIKNNEIISKKGKNQFKTGRI